MHERGINLQVQNALSRKGKEETVEKLTKAFEESSAVFGIKFNKLSVSFVFTISISH